VQAVLGLGSNLGDRLATLRLAVERLRSVTSVEAVSAVYESPPVGPPQPFYLNAAALVSWPGTAHALLDAALGVERGMGRVRAERWGPRTIDVDVLWIDGVALRDERLVVPHPELLVRSFALGPLLDVVPDAVDPRTGERYVRPIDPALSVFLARL
jgi:2-amino-4-hydroxy-6-hydroxymethyldihydropteridine diphosphokinase